MDQDLSLISEHVAVTDHGVFRGLNPGRIAVVGITVCHNADLTEVKRRNHRIGRRVDGAGCIAEQVNNVGGSRGIAIRQRGNNIDDWLSLAAVDRIADLDGDFVGRFRRHAPDSIKASGIEGDRQCPAGYPVAKVGAIVRGQHRQIQRLRC